MLGKQIYEPQCEYYFNVSSNFPEVFQSGTIPPCQKAFPVKEISTAMFFKVNGIQDIAVTMFPYPLILTLAKIIALYFYVLLWYSGYKDCGLWEITLQGRRLGYALLKYARANSLLDDSNKYELFYSTFNDLSAKDLKNQNYSLIFPSINANLHDCSTSKAPIKPLFPSWGCASKR